MLVNKKFRKDDIVSVKLLNGDEIIARILDEKSDDIIFSNPMALTITPKGPGVVPWFMLGDNSAVSIKKTQMFSVVYSKLDAAGQYLEHLNNPMPMPFPTNE
jgi:hypothetical protein